MTKIGLLTGLIIRIIWDKTIFTCMDNLLNAELGATIALGIIDANIMED